jgi:catechol 2,3-dioxygenase-like lactoylglutathione lyase family enzyme
MTAAKTHLSLNVANAERSAKWYAEFFAMPPHKVRPGYANFDLENPPLKLALNENPSASGGALNHLGVMLNSRDEVLEHRARLEQAVLAHSSEDMERCCHAIQTKVWANDPDGNMWEIYAIEDDLMEEEDAAAEAAACCQPVITPCCDGGCC